MGTYQSRVIFWECGGMSALSTPFRPSGGPGPLLHPEHRSPPQWRRQDPRRPTAARPRPAMTIRHHTGYVRFLSCGIMSEHDHSGMQRCSCRWPSRSYVPPQLNTE
jgi:hypothetical protein